MDLLYYTGSPGGNAADDKKEIPSLVLHRAEWYNSPILYCTERTDRHGHRFS